MLKTDINILTWLRGFQRKIVIFSSLFCLVILKRDLDIWKKKSPNVEVCPEIVQYWYVERWAGKRGKNWFGFYDWVIWQWLTFDWLVF